MVKAYKTWKELSHKQNTYIGTNKVILKWQQIPSTLSQLQPPAVEEDLKGKKKITIAKMLRDSFIFLLFIFVFSHITYDIFIIQHILNLGKAKDITSKKRNKSYIIRHILCIFEMLTMDFFATAVNLNIINLCHINHEPCHKNVVSKCISTNITIYSQ